MKVRITFNLDRRTTSAIAERIGKHRNATYDECRNHIEAIVDASLQVTLSEYDERHDEGHECENCGCEEHLPEPCETCDCAASDVR